MQPQKWLSREDLEKMYERDAFRQWLDAQPFSRATNDYQDEMRDAWNAAIAAAEAVIAEKHDPCEPWLDPGELSTLLKSVPR
jgi:Zn-finger nucleic acid-binding protein